MTILTITPPVLSMLMRDGWPVALVSSKANRYRLGTMSSQDFLGRLSPRERELIDARSARRTYRRGATLFLEGDSASEVLLIQRGHIKITVGSHDGREVLLEIRGTGDIIGEMGLIDNSVRSASAFSLTTPTEVLVLSVRDFRTLVDTDQHFTRSLLDEMVRKVRNASSHQLELALDDVAGRVARRLLDLDRRFGRMRDGIVRVKSPITQQEIADWAGISRQAVVKELGQLREQGIVETKGSVMTILDRDALVERAARLSGLA
jgi:CRP/FNR family cyclic AMP-dependent transcriptional regulator